LKVDIIVIDVLIFRRPARRPDTQNLTSCDNYQDRGAAASVPEEIFWSKWGLYGQAADRISPWRSPSCFAIFDRIHNDESISRRAYSSFRPRPLWLWI